MKRAFLDLLPETTQLKTDQQIGDEIMEGQLTGSFGVAPIIRGVPRFTLTEAYAASFGFEWQRFARVQLDSSSGRHESRRAFLDRTGLDPRDFKGKRILDAGCGAGRFTELFADAGAEIVGVDLSQAVDAAWHNVGQRPGAHMAQADLMGIPFRENTFDLVFSIGVLHHAASAERAFAELTRFVKPGGYFATWVYARSTREWTDALDDAYRSVTHRLPPETLYRLSHVAIPLGAALRILQTVPRIGPRLVRIYLALFPKVSLHPVPRWRVLDSFDWWSPRYRSFHTFAEVEGWFHTAQFHDVERLGVPVAVRGRRPVG
ncbi:MAG: hypothetical protein NVSMB2_20710 [Chloroflexota bacterium]